MAKFAPPYGCAACPTDIIPRPPANVNRLPRNFLPLPRTARSRASVSQLQAPTGYKTIFLYCGVATVPPTPDERRATRQKASFCIIVYTDRTDYTLKITLSHPSALCQGQTPKRAIIAIPSPQKASVAKGGGGFTVRVRSQSTARREGVGALCPALVIGRSPSLATVSVARCLSLALPPLFVASLPSTFAVPFFASPALHHIIRRSTPGFVLWILARGQWVIRAASPPIVRALGKK